MSKLEPSWTADLMRAAKLDGWLLAWCINSGHSINRAYLEIFEHGPRFEDREKAVRHVVQEARYGKKLHITAMTAVLHTRAANKRKR